MKLVWFSFLVLLTAQAFSQDRLGQIKASEIKCPTTGLKATACYALDIICPEISDYTAFVKVMVPFRPVGTIILSTGGDGNFLYENYVFGSLAVEDVVRARYTAVQLTFGEPFSDAPGWEHDAGGKGVRAASCRYATVVQWVHDSNFGLPICATGNSAGGQNISEGLAHYGLGDYLSFAEITSGPPFTRVDYACLNNVQPAVEYCSGNEIGMGVGQANAISFIDPAYPGPWCSQSMLNHSSQHQQQFLNDSVTSPDAVLSYPNTRIRFLFGSLDGSSAIRQGLNYQSHILQPTTFGCVNGAPHSIPDSLVGAETIASDLVQNCHR